METSREKWILG